MFTTLFALHTLLLIRLFCPVLSADSCICVVLSSDTFIMLGWGHAIQSVQFLMLVVQVAAQPTLFLSRYANLYTFGLDAHWLTATYQR